MQSKKEIEMKEDKQSTGLDVILQALKNYKQEYEGKKRNLPLIKTFTEAPTKIKEADNAIKVIEEEKSGKTQYSANDFANKILDIFSGKDIGSDTKSKLDNDGFPDNTRSKNLKKLLSEDKKYAAAFANQLAEYFIKNNIINTDVAENDDKNTILLKNMYSFAIQKLIDKGNNKILNENPSKFIQEYNRILSNNIDIEKYNNSVLNDSNEKIKYYEFKENEGIKKNLSEFSQKIENISMELKNLKSLEIYNIIQLYAKPLLDLQESIINITNIGNELNLPFDVIVTYKGEGRPYSINFIQQENERVHLIIKEGQLINLKKDPKSKEKKYGELKFKGFDEKYKASFKTQNKTQNKIQKEEHKQK